MTMIEMLTAAMSLRAAPPELSPWQAQLGDLLLGPGTPYDITHLSGLDELPPMRTSDEERPWADGEFDGDDWAAARPIGLGLEIMADDETGVTYDQALAALRAVMVPTRGDLVSLWVQLPSRAVLRWDVKVRRHRIMTDASYEMGLAVAEAELYAPDPVGYGAEVTASTGFRAMTGGLEFDLFTDGTSDTGFLEFGEAGSTGRVELSNPGTAETWPVYVVAGPSPAFEILDVTTGRHLQYTDEVPAGSSVSLDSATGLVLLDQVADRSGALVRREWSSIPPASTSSVMFLPLGPASPAATLTVTCSPGWW
ncbi:hypothetical protein ACFWGN_16130 [Oerskovia sp. NPDC060338]|uniref:hypothetical protein n=1 Tax=Oerskovia sp. NPDC060338 TaxID=3347100 RepID=UPI003669B932